jgi:cob(I)alamin adenosyltransferase
MAFIMRLTKIYTRQGDSGTTRLATGEKIAKSELLVSCMGIADHCNSVLGWASREMPAELSPQAKQIQHWLFDIGGELALEGYTAINESMAANCETWIDAMNTELTPLEEFILPGGSEAAARTQMFRSEIRSFERALVGLNQEKALNPETIKLVNRLSDWAFVAARFCNLKAEVAEPYWQPSAKA